MTLQDAHRLDAVLDDLVARDILSAAQARSVSDAVAALPTEPGPSPARERAPVATVPAPPVRPPWRARLVEAGAYAGALLVLAAGVAFVAQVWPSWSDLGRTLFLGATSAVLLVAGLLAALVPAGGRATLRRRDQSARRRLAGATMTLGAVLAAAAVLVGMVGNEAQGLTASLVMLGIVVVAQLLSASAVTEVALLGGAMVTLGTFLDYVEPAPVGDPAYWFAEPPLRAWDVVVPAAFVLLGLLWATVGPRVLSLPVLAQALGLVVAFTAAFGAMTDRRMQWGWFAVLVAFAIVGLLVHVRTRAWPWLVLCIASLTVAVFFLVAQSTNPALGLLVAGVVLLAASGFAVGLSRRAERRVRLEPTSGSASQVG